MQEKIFKLGMRTEAAAADPLERAAVENKPSVVADLMKQGVDINKKFTDGWTALHIGSVKNYPDLVTALLGENADIELCLPDGSNALHISAAQGHHKVVEVLLRHGARPDTKRETDGFTPLHLAAVRGRDETLRLLLDAQGKYGMDIDQPAKDGETILECACESDSLKCVEMLTSAGADVDAIVDEIGRTPLMNAATRDKHEVVDILLRAGADIDRVHGSSGMPAVTIAAFSGKLKVLETLIAKGANLDIMGKNGYTPLRAAIEGKQPEAAMLLLESRVKVKTIYGDHQDTVLHLAASRGMYNVAESIIKKEADLEALDSDGDPPLQWAVEQGDLKMCKILIRHGAEVNRKKENTGKGLLHWAVRRGHVGVTEFLLANKADKTLLNLSEIEKSDAADEDNFQLCKALVETAPRASEQFELSRSSTPTNSAAQVSDHAFQGEEVKIKPTTDIIPSPRIAPSSVSSDSPIDNDECHTEKSLHIPHPNEPLSSPMKIAPSGSSFGFSVTETKPASLDARIRFQALDIPGQEDVAERIFLRLTSALEHTGVTCDGPLCKGETKHIQGIRFKCANCENTDFCLDCASSFHNNHHGGHVMIRCLLPNSFHHIKEIDNDSKKQCIEACGEPSVTVDDLSHIVYGLPDIEDLKSQIASKCEQEIQSNELDQLLSNSTPCFFPVMKKPGYVADIRKRGIVDYRDDRPGGIHYYKVDDVGNVRVKQYHAGDDLKNIPRDDVLAHHQDPDTLLKGVFGELKHYDYTENRLFHEWAWKGRLVTRVIDIKPGDFDDKMQINIRVVDVNESPDYTALSYTWKETTYERAIRSGWTREDTEAARKMARWLYAVYCDDASGNERFLEINCGLRDALKRIRHKSENRTYWIDQISINQLDLNERSFQVSGMQFFFNRASQVTLWVGEEEEDTSEVFTIMENIVREFKRCGYLPQADHFTADFQSILPPFESDVWVSLLNFFDRPVFNRCWVIQEVVTAQKVILHCGNFSIGWDDLSKVAQTLCHRSWIVKLPQDRLRKKYTGLVSSPSNPQIQRTDLPGFGTVVMMNGLREDFHDLKRNSLENLLYFTFLFEASDPRDMVYSVLGIRSAQSKSSDPYQIKADYQKPVEEVFLDAAKICIMESSSFTICAINKGPSSKTLNQIPSWVPDLTAKSFGHVTALCRLNPVSPYRANGDVPIIATWPYEERPDMLVTSSCKIETIVSVSEQFFDDNNQSSVILEWTKMASRIGSQYPTGEFASDVFLRTCVVDAPCQYHVGIMPEELHVPLLRFFEQCFLHYVGMQVDRGEKIMDDILKESANEVIASLIADMYKWEDTLEANKAALNEGSSAEVVTSKSPTQTSILESMALEAISIACKDRRFFVTENNFIGLSSKDIHAGDEVHVLGGTCVPFVLRQVRVATEDVGSESIDEKDLQATKLADKDGLGLYRMIGESYVHGVMQGEALARDGAEWEGICLC